MEKRRSTFRKTLVFLLGSALIGSYAFWVLTRSPEENPRSSSPTESVKESPAPQANGSTPPSSENTHSETSTLPERSSELERLAEAARNALPDPSLFKGRSAEEVHHTPPEILEAGRKLGALAEYLETHPSEIRAALPTYVDCALNTKTMESIRALCAFRLNAYSSHWDERTREAYPKVPESIRNLAAQLSLDESQDSN